MNENRRREKRIKKYICENTLYENCRPESKDLIHKVLGHVQAHDRAQLHEEDLCQEHARLGESQLRHGRYGGGLKKNKSKSQAGETKGDERGLKTEAHIFQKATDTTE